MDPFLGDIELFAFDFSPFNWIPCEGQTLNIATNQDLFTLIGTTFGGNGTTTFCLPDLRNALPMQGMGMHYCIAVRGIYPSRNPILLSAVLCSMLWPMRKRMPFMNSLNGSCAVSGDQEEFTDYRRYLDFDIAVTSKTGRYLFSQVLKEITHFP
ncbi:tail fiber protein [Desulfosporosinus sp. OT]|uniref:tail fiber protein n=1 Tax=Desulfosporosinus sp. OT TaxID=913865 RepID=UPI000223B292|nr:phage Tail Collar domain protein [Desulfosporosinus sp. OT]